MTEDSFTEPLDAVDVVRGLAHMDTLIDLCSRARNARMSGASITHPRNAVERHLLEAGHLLQFGCCSVPGDVDRNGDVVGHMHRRGD
jgi:hypothetical protein